MLCAVLQVFSRSAKYSLFDPAKEMVYIEMDADEKKQGKAAVDLVGSQVGRGAPRQGRQHAPGRRQQQRQPYLAG